jgi:hypothetical protein
MALALLVTAARRPSGGRDLILDAADPIVAVRIGGVPMRLRVGLEWQDSIALNPAAAARLPVQWQGDAELDVGRVRLPGRSATAELSVAGRSMPTTITEHGRDCCQGVDGAISPALLPYQTVRWMRADAPPPTGTLRVKLTFDPASGLATRPGESGPARVRLRFAMGQNESVGTAAGGALLSQAWGGTWMGSMSQSSALYGVARPVRSIAFAHPGLLAGFRFATLPVRLSDFGGSERLPADPAQPGEVVVSHKLSWQRPWPAITIGGDRLNRCAEITYTAAPRTLTLNCAFDGAP